MDKVYLKDDTQENKCKQFDESHGRERKILRAGRVTRLT